MRIHTFPTHSLMAVLLLAFPAAIRAAEHSPADMVIEQFEVKQATVTDANRLLSEISGLNIVATDAAARRTVSLRLTKTRAMTVLTTLCKVSGLWYREDAQDGVIRLMTAEEYQQDLVVYREDQTRVFQLLYPNVTAIAQGIEDLYGERVQLSLGEIEEDGLFGQSSGIAGGTNGSGTGSSTGTTGFSRAETGRRREDSVARSTRRSTLAGEGATRVNRRDGLDDSQRVRGLTSGQLSAVEQQSHTEGKDPRDLLKDLTAQQPPIYVSVNRQHNLIVVRTSDSRAMTELERLIMELDRPVPQVLLEVKVFQINVGDDFNSVFDVSVLDKRNSANIPDGQPANPLSPGDLLSPRNVGGVGNFPLAAGSSLIYQYLNDNIRVRMQLLASKNRLKALATPMLLCANNSVARLFVGEQRPVVEGFETETIVGRETNPVVVETPEITLRDIGITLEIIPKINADRTVALRIFQDSSNVNPGVARIPTGGGRTEAVDTVSTANIEGTVVGEDGKTIAVGGLIRRETALNKQKVPGLGDIPHVGTLFSRTQKQDTRSEIILLITPHILMTPEEGRNVSAARLKALSANRAVDQHVDGTVPPAKKSDLLEWERKLLRPTEE